MAKVHTGEYGSGTTAENALNTALMHLMVTQQIQEVLQQLREFLLQ